MNEPFTGPIPTRDEHTALEKALCAVGGDIARMRRFGDLSKDLLDRAHEHLDELQAQMTKYIAGARAAFGARR